MKKIKILRKYIFGTEKYIFLSLFFAFISCGSKLSIPFLAGKTINLFTSNRNYDLIYLYVSLMLVFLFIGLITRYLFDFFTYKVGQDITKNMRDITFKHYLTLPFKFIDNKTKGDLLSRLINDSENVQIGLISGFASLYDGVVSILFIISFMFILSWPLALIVILLTPLSLFVAKFISKYNSKHFKAQAESNSNLTAFTLEELTHSEDISCLNIKKKREKEFKQINEKLKKDIFKANIGSSLINPSTRLINALINATIVLVGSIFILKNVNFGMAFSIGELLAFITYANNYMAPFNEISNVTSEVLYALSSLVRIDEMNIDENIINKNIPFQENIDNLTFKNVNFYYPNNPKKIINDFDINILKGQKIAIVGPTGSGKTTIINLLMNFYDTTSGNIFINSKNIKDINKENYFNHIAMVLQDTWIFNGTIKENIKYGKPDAIDEEIIEAAKKAKAHEFIMRLKDGYDTFLNSSSSLSLGEKQLICIARVMLMNKELLILDEATSNIDIKTEKNLNESFYELMKGKTSIVVAHRLNTIISSDLIIVLKDGSIIEKGTNEELIKKKGFYYDLITS